MLATSARDIVFEVLQRSGGIDAPQNREAECVLRRFIERGLETDGAVAMDDVVQMVQAAIDRLGLDEALVLFDQTDPATLLSKCLATYYLISENDGQGIPLCSRDELAERLQTLADFLRYEREHLLQAGLPARTFEACRWLHALLSRLYVTRRTMEVDAADGDASFPRWGQVRASGMTVEWVPPSVEALNVDPASQNLHRVQCQLDEATPILLQAAPLGVERIPCEMNEADLVQGLTAEDEGRLTAMRPRLLDLKIAILELLARRLRECDSADLWSGCLQILCEHLTGEEAEYLLRIDRVYLVPPERWNSVSPLLAAQLGYDGPFSPGGLTDLILKQANAGCFGSCLVGARGGRGRLGTARMSDWWSGHG